MSEVSKGQGSVEVELYSTICVTQTAATDCHSRTARQRHFDWGDKPGVSRGGKGRAKPPWNNPLNQRPPPKFEDPPLHSKAPS